MLYTYVRLWTDEYHPRSSVYLLPFFASRSAVCPSVRHTAVNNLPGTEFRASKTALHCKQDIVRIMTWGACVHSIVDESAQYSEQQNEAKQESISSRQEQPKGN